MNPLEAWLLDPERPAPPAALLRRNALAAYAYTVLPPGHPERAGLRGDYLASLARHQRIRAELLPLLKAWNEAGVEVLLFKGFHLAEFVYPAPGARFHGDVDVVVRHAQVERAREAARAQGWREEADTGRAYAHNVCSLHSPGGEVCVDLHRFAIQSELPWTGVPQRVTDAVWSASRERVWEGARIREASETDALLVGLVLQRCWGGDRWRLKAHDAIDFRLLSRHVPRAALEARARELGASGALRRFLERCDPDAGRLSLAVPARRERWAWDVAALAERGPIGPLQKGADALVNLPRWAPAAARAALRLLQARRALRRDTGLTGLLQSMTLPAVHPRRDPRERYHAVRAIVHLSRLAPHNPRGDCLVRSLAVYAELRSQGWPVSFVSGIRREGAGLLGHAWVELDGAVLPELGEPANRSVYTVNFTYPGSHGGTETQSRGSEGEVGAAEDQPAKVEAGQEGG
ncbi:MAG TPA: lasso peptide biosynthesis B2 protein [Longimicrobium sp.]|jgi:hypothetical protein